MSIGEYSFREKVSPHSYCFPPPLLLFGRIFTYGHVTEIISILIIRNCDILLYLTRVQVQELNFACFFICWFIVYSFHSFQISKFSSSMNPRCLIICMKIFLVLVLIAICSQTSHTYFEHQAFAHTHTPTIIQINLPNNSLLMKLEYDNLIIQI